MDDEQFVLQLMLLIKKQKEFVHRYLQKRNAVTNQIIRSSRQNFEIMQRRSNEFCREILFSAACMAVMNVVPRIRTISKKERNSVWWDHVVLQTYDDKQWLLDFRMNRETFFKLTNLVKSELDVLKNAFMPIISVEKKVAIALYQLSTCSEYSVIEQVFGVSRSTVCAYVHEFCKALIKTQIGRILRWPKPIECKRIAHAFEEKFMLPNVIGIIGCTHIPITSPKNNSACYINQKGYSSIAVQAVVDDRCLFRSVTAQHPGCTSDLTLLNDSYLNQQYDELIPHSNREIYGMYDANYEALPFQLPYYLIGGPTYPLTDWLIKDYINEPTDEEQSFNLYLKKAHKTIKYAFQRLKGRWKVLSSKSDMNVQNMPHIIIACCLLHNFVEMHKQQYLTDWELQRRIHDNQFPQPEKNELEEDVTDGNLIREHLCAYMSRNYPLLQEYK